MSLEAPSRPLGEGLNIPVLIGSHETRRWRKEDSNCWSHLRRRRLQNVRIERSAPARRRGVGFCRFGAQRRVCGDGSRLRTLIEEVRFASTRRWRKVDFETSVPSSSNAMSALWRVSSRRRTAAKRSKHSKRSPGVGDLGYEAISPTGPGSPVAGALFSLCSVRRAIPWSRPPIGLASVARRGAARPLRRAAGNTQRRPGRGTGA